MPKLKLIRTVLLFMIVSVVFIGFENKASAYTPFYIGYSPSFWFQNADGEYSTEPADINTSNESVFIEWLWWDPTPPNYEYGTGLIILFQILVVTNDNNVGKPALRCENYQFEDLPTNVTIVFRDYTNNTEKTSFGIYFYIVYNGDREYTFHKIVWTPEEALSGNQIVIPQYVYYLVIAASFLFVGYYIYWDYISCNNPDNKSQSCNIKRSNRIERSLKNQQEQLDISKKLFE